MTNSVDIAVIGSGAAGLAAAVSAARTGRTALLTDAASGAGGTGASSGLTTLCGLYDDEGAFLNDDFSREFAEAIAEAPPMRMGRVWALPYRPARFREVAEEFLRSTPGLQTRWRWPVAEVVVQDGRILRLNGVEARAVVDCTGTAEVARAAGAVCLETDATTQAPAVLFHLSGVRRTLDSPAAAAQVLLPLARAGLPPLHLHPGLDPGTVTVKFTGPARQVPDVIDCLRKLVRGFETCHTNQTTFQPAHRAGRMILGRYVLTGADVRAGARFPDAVARGAWPIEQWGADGVARVEYLARGRHYEIPARSLRARDVSNLFMAGKTISADVEAIASARVMGSCLATGAAAGQLAAGSLQSDP